jgi:hypothetical protein
MPKLAHNPQTEELIHLAGDAPDPDGSELRGRQSTMRLTKTALGRPAVRYEHGVQSFVLDCDVYEMPGAGLMVHLICPRCRHALRLTSERHVIEYDARDGLLSVQRLACVWELEGDGAVAEHFGTSLCRWTAAIDRNVARDTE